MPDSRRIEPLDPDFIADPYPALAQLREHGAGIGRDVGETRWIVTRHDDVHRLLQDRALSSDPRNGAPGTAAAWMKERLGLSGAPGSDAMTSMVFLDPPAHTRLRSLAARAFTPSAVEALRPRAFEIANELLSALPARFDAVEAFTEPFPTVVIAELLGVDASRRSEFKTWSVALFDVFDPAASSAAQARTYESLFALQACLREVVLERRSQPEDDFPSRLIATARDDGAAVEDEEVVSLMLNLLAAGNVTTTDLIGNGLLALLEHPGQLAELRATPALIANTVEEVLRFDSPVVETPRITVSETRVGDAIIPAGQSLSLSAAAANHDPRLCKRPEQFDIKREAVHHHSFGGGHHFCLGAPLARMEAEVAFGAILDRFPRLRLDRERPVVRRRLPGFRGVASLPVATD